MSDAVLLVLPVLLPLSAALLVVLARRAPRLRRALDVGCMAALVVVAALLLRRVAGGQAVATLIGGWPAPYGIPLVADPLSAVMVLVTAVVALATSLHALADDASPRRRPLVFQLVQPVLVAAACGAYLTGDLFNLYVWLEVMLMASFVLMSLQGGAPQLRGTIKYLASNLIASSLLLAGLGLLYGLAGTLNLAELSLRAPRLAPGPLTVVATLFLVAFGIKAAVFPLFAWLPGSYPTPPVTTTALFAGLLTKVGVYALLRTFTMVFTRDVAFTHGVLLWVAGLTMVVGALAALAQQDLRRLLSFSLVSQIGYMLMGIALRTPLALVAAIFLVVHDILAKTSLFLVGGAMARAGGSYELPRLGGLYRARPLLAALFLLPGLALAGVPPLPGFWGKLLLVRAGVDLGRPAVVAMALTVSLLTLGYVLKIWSAAFLSPAPADRPAAASRPLPRAQVAALVLLVGCSVGLGLLAGPACEVMSRAAAGLLAPRAYVEAVLAR